jgi:hypothetical protein
MNDDGWRVEVRVYRKKSGNAASVFGIKSSDFGEDDAEICRAIASHTYEVVRTFREKAEQEQKQAERMGKDVAAA